MRKGTRPRREHLDGQIRWSHLLETLGCRAAQDLALPTRARCPVCRRPRMQILYNETNASAWYWCPACHRAGDMVQLAARAWGLSPEAAIGKLIHEGLLHRPTDEELEQYAGHVAAQKGAAALWRAARRRHIHDSRTALKVLFERKILRETPPHSRWQEGLGAMLGWMTAEEFKRRLQPLCPNNIHNLRIPSSCRELLVLAGRDLPLRLASLVLILDVQDQLRWPFLVHSFSPREKCGPTNSVREDFSEGGLFYHPAVRRAARQWDRQIVATPDIHLMLRMQAERFERSTVPLPLAAFLDGSVRQKKHVRTHSAWQMFAGYRMVLWLPGIAAEWVRQMWLADALVCTWQPGKGDSKLAAFDREEDILRRVLEKARPWPEALAEYLLEGNDSRAERLLGEMTLRDIRLEPLLDAAPESLRKRLRRILDSWSEQSGRTVLYSRYRIVERSDGWYAVGKRSHKQGELITDAMPRIHQVVQYRDSGKTYFRGEIRYRGRDWPFMEERQWVDGKNTVSWLDTFLAVNGIGVPQVNPRWARFIMSIAKTFRPPELVMTSGSLGWDAERGRFVLPRFAVHVGGKVAQDTGVLLPKLHPSDQLAPPEALTPEELARPRGRAGRLFWAVFAALAANVLAPAAGEPHRRIALSGHSGKRLGEIVARAIGAEQIDLKAAGTEYPHRWPFLIEAKESQLLMAAEGEEIGPYAVAPCRETGGLWLVLQGGWLAIEENEALAARDDLLGALAQRLLPAYLQDLCQRNLRPTAGGEADWHRAVLKDVAAYVERLGQSGDLVRSSDKAWLLDDPASTWAVFRELAQRLQQRQPESSKPLLDKNVIHIRRINTAVRREGLPPLNWTRLLQCLEGLGKLAEVRDREILLRD